jgi:hypothetical protein
VISVGDELSSGHLQQLANAGVGYAPIGTQMAPYYKALSADALVHAFDQILGEGITCRFALEGHVDPERMCEGTVTLDGTPLPCESQWKLVDPGTLELIGAACSALKDGAGHVVEASFPCGVVG